MKQALPYIKLLFILCLLIGNIFTVDAQGYKEPINDSLTWDYSLPIWGKKVVKRGYKLPLPYGFNFMYINTSVSLDITKFKLKIGDGKHQELIDEKLNTETLNFTETKAYFNGVNFRPDFWLLPFLNVYGIVTTGKGSTEVALSPKIPYGNSGDVLNLPAFGSKVNFFCK